MAEDLNARRKAWGDHADNQRGKYMRQWAAVHDIHYKLRIITPAFPTFKPAQTFVDICLADSRLVWMDALNDKARTLPYDSDDTAISLTFEVQNEAAILKGPPCYGIRHNYRATKCDKFVRKTSELYMRDVPRDINLSITEVDNHLHYITNTITRSMSATIPVYKHSDSVNKYLNHKIRKLQRAKAISSHCYINYIF